MTDHSDIDLCRFRAGDPEVFRDLVRAHTAALGAVARAFRFGEPDVQDIVQSTWAQAFAQRARFSGSGSIRGWLMAITRHLCIDAIRADRTRRERHPQLVAEASIRADIEPARPHGGIEVRKRQVVRRFTELSDREREALTSRLLDGLSTRETAVRMGCAPGTVKSLIHRAVKKLRQSIEKESACDMS